MTARLLPFVENDGTITPAEQAISALNGKDLNGRFP
jgi:hypothetical protein